MSKFVRKRRFLRVIEFLDVALLLAIWMFAFVATNITLPEVRSTNQGLWLGVLTPVCCVVMLHQKGLYSGRPTLPRTEEISRLVSALLIGVGSSVVIAEFLDWHVGAWEIVTGIVLSVAATTLLRGVMRTIVFDLAQRDQPERLVVVGAGAEAAELIRLVSTHPEAGFVPVGVIGNKEVAVASGLEELWLGDVSDMVVLMHRHSATSAIVCATGFRGEKFRTISSELLEHGYDVQLSTGVTRLWTGRFEVRSLSHEPLVVMGHRSPNRRRDLILKRGIDLVGATVALLIFLPALVAVAFAIKLEDRGPIFFRQQRIGKNGETFEILKFRSMCVNAEEMLAELASQNERGGPLFKMTDDPRRTRVGRVIRATSLDELPQLINVLGGTMSLVGPRPPTPDEAERFSGELRRRFEVAPGITGLWQVEARSNSDFEAYKRLDLHYAENWSVGLDLRILLATVEQTAVSLLLTPVSMAVGRGGSDTIDRSTISIGEIDKDDTVIELTERTTARARSAESPSPTEVTQP